MTEKFMIPHLRRQGNMLQLMVQNKPFIMLAGELHNSSASSLDYLCPLLDKVARCHLNTVLAPISWELVEPVEGRFDFSLVDGIIEAARARGLKLVLLWFGTMKNAISCYAPSWVKTDQRRFPRAETEPGMPSWTVSPFCKEAMQCDSRAFARLMRRIREVDATSQTVIMMQVENETGILNAPRDLSAEATVAFAAEIPSKLLGYIAEKCETLRPELRKAWEGSGSRRSGSWQEVFGADAEEFLMGWQIASFVDAVAESGRREYDLPMYANAWLCGGPGFPPGKYPSGGPISKLLDVWRAAAPHIDLIAPDIYLKDFRDVCADYSAQGNTLFIPEASNEPVASANALYALGRHDALGFSPFGIEDIDETHPIVETYRNLSGLLPVIATARGTGRMTAFIQEADEEKWDFELGGFRFNCRTRARLAELKVPGSAILILMEEGEFVCVGRNLIFTFTPPDGKSGMAEILEMDIGEFVEGQWRYGHRLNGDESSHGTGIVLGMELTVRRFRLFALQIS